MPSRDSSTFRAGMSFSTKLTVRFAILLFLSIFFCLAVLSIVIKNELYKKDQAILQAYYNDITAVISERGADFLISSFLSESQIGSNSALLLHLVDKDGKEIYNNYPDRIESFSPLSIEQKLKEASARSGHYTIKPKVFYEETIELVSGEVGGVRVVVGVSTDDSEDFLLIYLRTSLYLLIFVAVASFVVGYFSSRRALEPVRQLIRSMKEVQSGRFRAVESPSLAHDELQEMTELFNVMVNQVNSHIHSLQQSLDSIAHDLRTPLTYIINRLEQTIQTARDGTVSTDVIYECLEDAQKISEILHTLLELTAADNQENIHRESFQVKKMVVECLEIYQYVIDDRKAQVRVEGEDFELRGDRNKIKRAMANLIDNALKYTGEQSNICIRLDPEHQEIRVEDNGRGIASNDILKIWQRLYRGDSSRHSPGMGLGLSFVKAIVEAHGWQVRAESQLGQGSTFTIRATPP